MRLIENFIPRMIADKALRMSFLCIAAVVLSFSTASRAADKKTTTPDPKTIKRTFSRGTDEAKEKLANDLKLRSKAGNSAACTLFEDIRISYPVLEPQHSYAVLILRSQVCWEDYVVVMENEISRGWEFIVSYPVFSKYGHSRITFPSLLRQGQQEIMVDRDCLVNGTGLWQYNTTVIRFQDRKPEVIFDEIQELNFFIPERVANKEEVGNTEETEHGSFFIVSSDPPTSSLSDILEKQVIARHRHRIVRWRLFSWDAEMNRFRSQSLDDDSASNLLKKVKTAK